MSQQQFRLLMNKIQIRIFTSNYHNIVSEKAFSASALRSETRITHLSVEDKEYTTHQHRLLPNTQIKPWLSGESVHLWLLEQL